MRTSIICAFFLLCTPLLYTQVLELKVGMSEKELIKRAMPGRIESGMKFENREGPVTFFRQEIDSSYTLRIIITTKRGKIYHIRKQHIGWSVDKRRTLFAYFKESITNSANKANMEENPELAQTVAREFSDKGVRAKAFNNKKRKYMEIFMFYNNKTSSVFVEIEGAS
ncbi:MAG: hypothetical protein AAFR87_16310 [Bacteroidota bacterium]